MAGGRTARVAGDGAGVGAGPAAGEEGTPVLKGPGRPPPVPADLREPAERARPEEAQQLGLQRWEQFQNFDYLGTKFKFSTLDILK